MNKKIISFSLWGTGLKYNIGAIENAKLKQTIYPDWIARFYLGKSVPENTVNSLKEFANIELIFMDVDGDWSGMFWRFIPAFNNENNIVLSRDTDSRLSIREREAVNEWLNSDKDFHIMRDHPYHGTEILGGMWGSRNNILFNQNIELNLDQQNFWQVDQNFLRSNVYPKIKEYATIHDSYGFYNEASKKFPTERYNKEFVGEIYDENNIRHPDHYTLI